MTKEQVIIHWQEKNIEKIIKQVRPEMAQKYAPIIVKYARKYKISPYVITAILWQESHFNNSVLGHNGEIGAAQIMPLWANKFNIPVMKLWDLETNIEVCAKILAYHKNRFGNIRKAIHAYNGLTRKGRRYVKMVYAKMESFSAYL